MKRLPIALILLAAGLQTLAAQTSLRLSSARASESESSAPDGSRQSGSPGSSVSGPTLTFVFDHVLGVIRRVPGIDGSAFVGEPVFTQEALSEAFTAPQQDYVVGLSTTGRVTLITMSHGAAIAESPLASAPANPDRVIFSPSGNSLGLYYGGTRTLMFFGGVPVNAASAAVWDLSQYGGEVTALAVQDSGIGLAGITRGDGTGSLVLLRSDSSTSVVMSAKPSAIHFLWTKNDAVVADSSAASVNLLQNVSGTLQSLTLVREADGLTHPDLLAVDRNSRFLVAAQTGERSGVSVDLNSGTIRSFRCDCAITKLEPMNGAAVYRLSDLSGGGFPDLSLGTGEARLQTIGAGVSGLSQTR